jgi:23S rRNA pseudouridine955/2504/2580 synthase
MVKIEISEAEAGQRLDRFLKKTFRHAPLSLIYRWIRTELRVNGRKASPDARLQPGDRIDLAIPKEAAAELEKRPVIKQARRSFGIAYEDTHLLAVEKPFGLLTHGTEQEKKDTLANQVVAYLQATGSYKPGRGVTFTPAPAHRLDRNTTGLVLFGKDYETVRYLAELLREKSALRRYYVTLLAGALTHPLELRGRLTKDTAENIVRIREPEEYSKGNSTQPAGKSISIQAGKTVLTKVNPLSVGERFTLVEVELITGRSHQIRAHLASAGYPLIGDPKYGRRQINRELKDRYGLSTQVLHAWRLQFGEVTGPLEQLAGQEIVSEWPEQLKQLASELTGA